MPPLIDQVHQAVLLLESVGVRPLCYDASSSNPEIPWEAFVPSCHEEESFARTPLGAAFSSSYHEHRHLHEFDSPQAERTFYLINIAGVVVCVFFVALISGLFLGLLTLDVMDLQIVLRASIDEDEKLHAATIYPIVQDRHRLLVTLLILNALAYESMPLFLDALVSPWLAVVLSTTLILVFGEILPSGVFMGPNQLYLGAKMAPLVKVALWLLYPAAMPLALLLDYLVHEEGEEDNPEAYNRGELTALIRIQHEQRQPEGGRVAAIKTVWHHKTLERTRQAKGSWSALKKEIMEAVKDRDVDNEDDVDYDMEEDPVEPAVEQLVPPLHQTEVDLVEGSLQMGTLLAMDIYKPLRSIYTIPENNILDREGITQIYSKGYSRVPVYRPNKEDPSNETAIVGFLMTRNLIMIDWLDSRPVKTLPIQRPDCISPRMNLVRCLHLLRIGGYHMAFVCARPDLANAALEAHLPIPSEGGFMGIITLEDIMEAILQDQIYDEVDYRDRERAIATLHRWAAKKVQAFYKKSKRRRREELERQTSGELASGDHSESTDKTPLLASPSENSNNGRGQHHHNYDGTDNEIV